MVEQDKAAEAGPPPGRDSAGAMPAAAAAPGAPPCRIAFLHIPKTAGSSFTAALAQRWGRVRIVATAEEVDALDAEAAAGLDLLAGHFYAFQLDRPAFAGFTPVTVLRDPYRRLRSSYAFARMCAERNLPLTPAMAYAARVPFAEYAFSGIAAADRHAQLYLLGLTGTEAAGATPLGDLLVRARQRLEGMRVGVTEALQPFLDRLFRESGAAAAPPLGNLVATGAAAAEDDLTAAQKAALRDLLAPDFALHAHARELMLRRLEHPPAAPGPRPHRPIPMPGVSGPVSDLIHRLKTMPGPIGNFQKLCDAADWADPRLLAAVREGFRLQPRLNPRLWEFGMAYVALARAGMLDGGATGLTFGSGREPLIFAAAQRAARLVATDLYTADTSWDIARTTSPKEFVLRAAPPGFDASNLEVRSMDMRQVDAPDASFDFCYSISAFEHIGDDPDFLQHLREVRRVLRPGGVYVMSTEIRLGRRSNANRGNYSFAIEHLLGLFREAGLHPEPQLDMRLSDLAENDPRDLTNMRHHDPADGHMMTLVVREFGGIMSAPVLFVLRAEPQGPVRVEGLEDTLLRVQRAYDQRTAVRVSDWMRLNPWGLFGTGRSEYCDLHARPEDPMPERPVVFATGYNAFGTGTLEVQVVLAPSPGITTPAAIDIAVNEWAREDLKALRPCYRSTMTVNQTPGAAATLRFRIPVDAGNRYAILGSRRQDRVLLAAADVQVRRVPPGG
jgi:SAM-dependent methyltransferase